MTFFLSLPQVLIDIFKIEVKKKSQLGLFFMILEVAN